MAESDSAYSLESALANIKNGCATLDFGGFVNVFHLVGVRRDAAPQGFALMPAPYHPADILWKRDPRTDPPDELPIQESPGWALVPWNGIGDSPKGAISASMPPKRCDRSWVMRGLSM